jgi:hypothetical protein
VPLCVIAACIRDEQGASEHLQAAASARCEGVIASALGLEQ